MIDYGIGIKFFFLVVVCDTIFIYLQTYSYFKNLNGLKYT